jgi:hypothetical protein
MKKILVRNSLKLMTIFTDCIYKVPSSIFKNKYLYSRCINSNAFGITFKITYKNEK